MSSPEVNVPDQDRAAEPRQELSSVDDEAYIEQIARNTSFLINNRALGEIIMVSSDPITGALIRTTISR